MKRQAQVYQFQEEVWTFYDAEGRHDLPWRQPESDGSFDPYKIMLSEIMLQQTQVNRVISKYAAFLTAFPTVEALARAELGSVLRQWQGLGYNRRAKYLWQAAQTIVEKYDGVMPSTIDELVGLPGIGKNTAGAIMAYAYDRPMVFIETNIRAVYIHHYFAEREKVSDAEITRLVADTLPEHESTRVWYWALMDYGSHLKRSVGSLNDRSKHYVKQSPFQGSKRQVRGAVLRVLSDSPKTVKQLKRAIPDERLQTVLGDLVREGLVREINGGYQL